MSVRFNKVDHTRMHLKAEKMQQGTGIGTNILAEILIPNDPKCFNIWYDDIVHYLIFIPDPLRILGHELFGCIVVID